MSVIEPGVGGGEPDRVERPQQRRQGRQRDMRQDDVLLVATRNLAMPNSFRRASASASICSASRRPERRRSGFSDTVTMA